MHLYLLRHAIAVPRGTPGYPNDDRPLTEEGARRMTRAAEGLARVVGRVDVILTSPLSRALQTARIAAEALDRAERVQLCDALLPTEPAREVFSHLRGLPGASGVLLVGHEPTMGLLASLLLGTEESVVEFRKGAACLIEVSSMPPERPGLLRWHLQPRHLRALAGGKPRGER